MVFKSSKQRKKFFVLLGSGKVSPDRPTWIRKGKTKKTLKKLSSSGRVRVVGHRNKPDREASKERRKNRVPNWVNNPDKSKSGRITKNFRRRPRRTGLF